MSVLDELSRLRRARDRMDREYDRDLSVSDLADDAAMSLAHFSRRFVAAYGETPHSYLVSRRIERAASLLRRGDVSVTQACLAVGWLSPSSFCARFKDVYGETPSAYASRDHARLAGLNPCHAMFAIRPVRARRTPQVSSFEEARRELSR